MNFYEWYIVYYPPVTPQLIRDMRSRNITYFPNINGKRYLVGNAKVAKVIRKIHDGPFDSIFNQFFV